jgi:hypothetical protein
LKVPVENYFDDFSFSLQSKICFMRGYLMPFMMAIVVNGFAQNVGIGTLTPTAPLDVVGKIKATSLQVTENPGLHKLLTSDADGNAFWIDPIWRIAPNSSTTKQFGNVGIGEITTPAMLP